LLLAIEVLLSFLGNCNTSMSRAMAASFVLPWPSNELTGALILRLLVVAEEDSASKLASFNREHWRASM
jgi:hypothetical protein